MTQLSYLNTDEMSALQGMTLEARVLYVFELRRYADSNGITGRARRHSYQSFREQLTVIPDWGSKQAKTEVTEKKIRVVLAELERHGLIEKLDGPLVFCLPLAMQYQSVQKRKGGGRAAVGAEGQAEGRADENTTASTVSSTGRAEGRAEGRAGENREEGRTSPITNIHINNHSNAREKNATVVSIKRPVPPDFAVSEKVRSWAIHRFYDRLDEHLDNFVRKCQANGYAYADFDAAFMTAIVDDWAGLRKAEAQSNAGRGRSQSPNNNDTSWFTEDLLEPVK